MKRFFATIHLNLVAKDYDDARVLVRAIEADVNKNTIRSQDDEQPGLYEAWYDDIEEAE